MDSGQIRSLRESIESVEKAVLESAARPAINKCANCGCNDWKNLISITYNYNLPEHNQLLTEESKKIIDEIKAEYEARLKKYNTFMETGVDTTITKQYQRTLNQLGKIPEHFKPKIWNPYINQNYCGYCKHYFQELEIKRLNGISMKEIESKETFEDFIEKSRLWHAEQLNSKDKEVLELKLQLKEKENEILTLKLRTLESKLTEKLTTNIQENQ